MKLLKGNDKKCSCCFIDNNYGFKVVECTLSTVAFAGSFFFIGTLPNHAFSYPSICLILKHIIPFPIFCCKLKSLWFDCYMHMVILHRTVFLLISMAPFVFILVVLRRKKYAVGWVGLSFCLFSFTLQNAPKFQGLVFESIS